MERRSRIIYDNYDIAKQAGVSASTVSRVINNKPGINEKTRARVRAIIEEPGFTLNEIARGLSVQLSKMTGILLEDIRISHHTEAAYIIEQELTKRGTVVFDKGYIEIYEYPRGKAAVITYTEDGCQESIIAGRTEDALVYEVEDMEAAVAGERNCMYLQYTEDVMDIMTKLRKDWDMKYPEEIS